MRMLKIVSLLSISSSFLLFKLPAHSAVINAPETVNFRLEDYAELGDIKDRVDSGFTNLEGASIGVNSSFNYSTILLNSLGSLPQVGTATKAIQAIELADLVSSLNSVFTSDVASSLADQSSATDVANNLNGLVGGTSAVDFSLSNAGTLSQRISALGSETVSPIEAPTLEFYYSVAASGRARSKAAELRNSVRDDLKILGQNQSIINDNISSLDQYIDASVLVQNQSFSLLERIGSEVPVPLSILFKPVAEFAATAIADAESNIQDAQNLQQQLNKVDERVSNRIPELQDWENSIDYALEIPPIPSDWTIFADVPSSGNYKLEFTGRAFDHPFTEIEGRFLIGDLTLGNNIGQVGTENSVITFTANRTVLDPVFGKVETPASVPLSLTYVTTPNTDDREASSDIFRVPDLGIDVRVYEGAEINRAQVYAQYDSPLRIVGIELDSNDDGGFITSIGDINNRINPTVIVPTASPSDDSNDPTEIPEPGIGLVWLLGAVGLLAKGKPQSSSKGRLIGGDFVS